MMRLKAGGLIEAEQQQSAKRNVITAVSPHGSAARIQLL